MENLDVLVRGVVMQNPGGLGLGMINFAGLEWAWIAVVVTIVVAFVSVKRVSIVSVGLTWRGTPRQVRVRVQSFSSSSDGNCIVTASGMFSAELVRSAEPLEAKSSLECASDASKVAAEMVFIFEKKTTSVVLPRTSSALRAEKAKTRRRARAVSKTHTVLYSDPQLGEGITSVNRREGIEWDPVMPPLSHRHSLDTFDMKFRLPAWAQSLTKPVVYTTSSASPSCTVKNTSSCLWDPLLKLKMRDAVVCAKRKCLSVGECRLGLAPVPKGLDNIVTLQNDVVRLWDSSAKSVMKRVHLPQGYAAASAFDVDWDSKVTAVGRVDGSLSLVNLERATYEKSYQSEQPVVQALQFIDNSLPRAILVATANAGCSVSVWDTRTSSRQLNANLNPGSAIYGLRSQGHELYVQDELDSLSVHDVRMLGALNVSRMPHIAISEGALEDRWWDVDGGVDADKDDDADEFWDCQRTDDAKERGGSLVGSFVLAISRGFCSKPR